MRGLLYPLLRAYDGVVAARNLAFDRGWRKIERLQAPVISVGNLAPGGTGKTPVTAELAKALAEKGANVAILSRGYGRRQPDTSRLIDPQGDWRLSGDEPMLLARRRPPVQVCVGPSRAQAAAALETTPDVYLIDDGFQHRQLHRDLDIVLIDVTHPPPHRHSTHFFREHFQALKRAHAVLFTRHDGRDISQLETRVRHINPDLICCSLRFKPGEIRDLQGRALMDGQDLGGVKVAAYSGIERPQKFFDVLRTLGAEVVVEHGLGDHHALSEEARESFHKKAQNRDAAYILTTEKDAVKLDPSLQTALQYAILTIDIDWVDTQQTQRFWNLIFQRANIHDEKTS